MKEPTYLRLCSDCAHFGLTLESSVCSSCIYTFNKKNWKDKNKPEYTCDTCRYVDCLVGDPLFVYCDECQNFSNWEAAKNDS